MRKKNPWMFRLSIRLKHVIQSEIYILYKARLQIYEKTLQSRKGRVSFYQAPDQIWGKDNLIISNKAILVTENKITILYLHLSGIKRRG